MELSNGKFIKQLQIYVLVIKTITNETLPFLDDAYDHIRIYFSKIFLKIFSYIRDFVVFPDTFELLGPGVFDNQLLEPGVGRM